MPLIKKGNKKGKKAVSIIKDPKKDTYEIFEMSKKYKDLLDHTKVLKNTKNKGDLSITLKPSKIKGVGLYSTKPIQTDETIAYYKIRVFKQSDYKSPTNYMYSFDVYRKDGEEYKRLIGDLDLTSFPEPMNDVPFWAPFANEPSKGQRSNAEIDMNLKDNYKNRTTISSGQIMIYKLVAKKYIGSGEEILWYYGEDYRRDYPVSKL